MEVSRANDKTKMGLLINFGFRVLPSLWPDEILKSRPRGVSLRERYGVVNAAI